MLRRLDISSMILDTLQTFLHDRERKKQYKYVIDKFSKNKGFKPRGQFLNNLFAKLPIQPLARAETNANPKAIPLTT